MTSRIETRAPSLVPSEPAALPFPPLPFHVPFRAAGEAGNVARALTGSLATGGAFAAACERRLEALTGAGRVHFTGSCTAALEAIALALDLGPGDEVIVPAFTFCATAAAFARTGARVVPCDVAPDTLMAGPEQVAARLSARTRAVVAVHYGGSVADLAGLDRLCRARNVALVEDAAQAIGASRDGVTAGSVGRYAAWSFHETKVIQCGAGGALAVNDVRDRRAVARVLDRGTDLAEARAAGRRYEWVGPGSTFRGTELAAAVLLAQLDELGDVLAHRRCLVAAYRRALADGPCVPLAVAEGTRANGHFAAVLAPDAACATRLMERAARNGLDLSAHYRPLHLEPAGRRLAAPGTLPVAEGAWDRLVRLPVHTAMDERDVARVAAFLARESVAA